MKGKGSQQQYLLFCWFYSGGWHTIEKGGTSEKRWVATEHWHASVHFVLRFQENFIYTLHLCISEVVTKWCKVYTKADFWFQKSDNKDFKQPQTSSRKSKHLNFDGLLLSKKRIPSAETWYTEDLSNITFNYLCSSFTKFHVSFLKP